MSDMTVVSCPHCGKQYSMTPEQTGQTVQCTSCQQMFTAGVAPLPGPPRPGVPPAYPPPPFRDPLVAAARETNGMAIASLVCGVLFCIPLSGLLAIIFGIFGLIKTKDPRYGGKGMSIAGIVLGALFLPLMLSILLPSLNRAREIANRVKCSNNLKQIGIAINLYTNDNHGVYPPDLGMLFKNEDLPLTVFTCPSSSTSLPTGLTPDQTVTWIDANSDYVYAGAGFSVGQDPNGIVAYEKDTDHGHDGMNILFSDGHVDFLDLSSAHRLIAKQRGG